MTIDLYRLDGIQDYDEGIEALEQYVQDLVEEFFPSPECKGYLKAHPMMREFVGSWIDHFLYFGYNYETVTLPHINKDKAEVILTILFPKKVSLGHPDEAATTIPELRAFWQYLKRVYKLRNAARILKLLDKIEPKFKRLMNDPANFGMAKSFLMSGMEAGFDMTTQAGIEAFQQQYNQNIQKNPPAGLILPPGMQRPNGSNSAGSSSSPNIYLPDSIPSGRSGPLPMDMPSDWAEQLGDEERELLENMPPELAQLFNLLMEQAQTTGMSPEELLEKMESDEDFEAQLKASFWQTLAEEIPPLPEEAIALLHQQTISDTDPGTILKDFQTLLAFIGENGIPVSSKQQLIPLKHLQVLNERLSEPVHLDLKRPRQKSFPPINGLYLLLRCSGIGEIIAQGKTNYLMLNSAALSRWQQMNATERYFTLLETWMIRGDGEVLGEGTGRLSEGEKIFQFWPQIPRKGQKIANYDDQQLFSHLPGLHNLALMHLFGWIHLETGKPSKGKGWRIKRFTKLPFGDVMTITLVRAFTAQGMSWPSEQEATLPLGELQPVFQPYFPEWQQTLTLT